MIVMLKKSVPCTRARARACAHELFKNWWKFDGTIPGCGLRGDIGSFTVLVVVIHSGKFHAGGCD